jgi:hypothetical protein
MKNTTKNNNANFDKYDTIEIIGYDKSNTECINYDADLIELGMNYDNTPDISDEELTDKD